MTKLNLMMTDSSKLIRNDHMMDIFDAGYILCVDEMMSMWYGWLGC